ncbi:MAG: helix-turn-helix domain-containing protein [Arenicellales bacterium]
MSVPDLTQPVPEPAMSAGRILAEKRSAWGLSIQDVASNLNLGVETIEALEADNYDHLPGTTFVKGYIRAYARLLKLDVEDLMGNIDLQPERITEIPSTRAALKQKGKTRSREKKTGSGKRLFKWLLFLFILAVLAAVGISQLPKLGIQSVSDLLTLPGQQANQSEGNEINIPGSETGQSSENKEALIRIE